MTTNGYRSDLTCPCGATATFEDANGFLIAGWVREWSELHSKHAKPVERDTPSESHGESK